MSKILKERDEFNQLSNTLEDSAIEYWFARDLQKNACENSSIEVIELMRNDKLKNLREQVCMSEFDEWNEIKKETNKDSKYRNFKEREIFYIKMGHNIGFEQNGKGKQFIRPVVILKKFNKNIFFVIPISSQCKERFDRLTLPKGAGGPEGI